MALTHKFLAKGQVAATPGTIYTAPAATTGFIKAVYFHNTSSSDETVKVYYDGTSAADRIFEGIISGKDTLEWDVAYSIILPTGDTLQAETTTGTTLNYIVFGAEDA